MTLLARQTAGLWLLAGGIAAAVGSFLPWATIEAGFLGTLTRSGMEGGDGWISLILGGLVAFGGVRARQLDQAVPSRTAQFVLGALLFALTVFEFADISNRSAEALAVSEGVVSASPAIGLFVIGAGAIASVVGASRLPT